MSKNEPSQSKPTGDPFHDDAAINAAMRQAGRDAVKKHRQLGLPLIIWRNGRVCEVPADEFDLDDGPESTKSPNHNSVDENHSSG